jgi:uncharacterized protein DUF3108
LFCALTLVALSAQTPPKWEGRIEPPRAGYKFPSGTTYVYQAEWRLWNAGTASISLDGTENEEHISAVADSTGFVSLLFTVRDHFEATLDPKTFCSRSITKHTEEGLRKRETHIRFDGARLKSVLDETNPKTGEKKHQERDIPACVTDVLSGIFYVGAQALAPDARTVFPVNDGGTTTDVIVRVEARESVTVPAGTFHTVRVQPEAASGPVREKGRMWIWYSDDSEHIPVQMRGRLFWGTLTLRLVRIDRNAP